MPHSVSLSCQYIIRSMLYKIFLYRRHKNLVMWWFTPDVLLKLSTVMHLRRRRYGWMKGSFGALCQWFYMKAFGQNILEAFMSHWLGESTFHAQKCIAFRKKNPKQRERKTPFLYTGIPSLLSLMALAFLALLPWWSTSQGYMVTLLKDERWACTQKAERWLRFYMNVQLE